jgi:hypothetical protein
MSGGVLHSSGDSNEQNAHTQDAIRFFFVLELTNTDCTVFCSQSTYSSLFCRPWAADTRLREYGQSIIWPNFNGISVLHMNWQTAVDAFLMTSTKKTMV